MGKPDQIGEIQVISSILFRHYIWAHQKAGPDIERAFVAVFVFILGTTNLFEFVERRYFEHFGRTSKSAI